MKLHLDETPMSQQGSWNDCWADALKIILKAQEYDETYNQTPRGKHNKHKITPQSQSKWQTLTLKSCLLLQNLARCAECSTAKLPYHINQLSS